MASNKKEFNGQKNSNQNVQHEKKAREVSKQPPVVKFSKSESMQMEYWKLEENIDNLKRMITTGKNKGYNTYNLEIECSYLEHEKFIRDSL